MERETRTGEKKERKRDRDWREKDRETGAGEREREIGRETGVGERGTGEKEKKLQVKKIHGILSCRASIRLPETRWERKR